MAERSFFPQNVIALIWDFDHTLSPHYMQKPLFDEYGIDEQQFWNEVRALPEYYRRAGIHVHRDTCYLGHLLSYVAHGRMPDLTNAKLRALGSRIRFFTGVPDIFQRLRDVVTRAEYASLELRVEHYVVSTGIAEMIRGSAIAPYLNGVWASEFIETPAAPGEDLQHGTPPHGQISQIASFLDNTTKTRALFEINKGVNVEHGITVNDMIPENKRRVPFQNMIYIADGPSDIPSFSVVRKHGGLAYAVYNPESDAHFEQAVRLLENQRVDAYGPADFSCGSQTDKWLLLQVDRIAKRIAHERQEALEKNIRKEPRHL